MTKTQQKDTDKSGTVKSGTYKKSGTGKIGTGKSGTDKCRTDKCRTVKSGTGRINTNGSEKFVEAVECAVGGSVSYTPPDGQGPQNVIEHEQLKRAWEQKEIAS